MESIKTKIILSALVIVSILIFTACGNNQSNKETNKNTSEELGQNKFDVNNPDEWPVKFSDYGFTPETYAQTETNSFMEDFINRSGVNNFFHFKTLTKKEDHWVVSPNNDVLYSLVVVDASDDFTLIVPSTNDPDRIMSVQIIDGDHFTPKHFYGAGEYTFPKGTFNTPQIAVGIRVEVNPTDPEDIEYIANKIQPEMKIIAKSSKSHVPKIDREAMLKLRKALIPYYEKLPNSFGGMTKNASEVKDEWYRMLCTAGAWGLSEDEHAMYAIYAPNLSADKCYTATYQVPPQDGFWSITMYDANKYLVSNDRNVLNKYNTVFNDDGTFTVHFGSKEHCGDVANRLDTVNGWNFLMRAYKPDIDGFKAYKMPEVKPVEM